MDVRKYQSKDLDRMISIWNEVVRKGNAFPQTDLLDQASAARFFASQTFCAVAVEQETVLGLYILHPNNIGRVGHIANASYAVCQASRGKGVGRLLVEHSLAQLPLHGFRILQFNAVVASNTAAITLYERLGFQKLGTIREGFAKDDGTYEDIIPMVYYVNGR
nr:GNAT family N-acetyltransferase [uncultured Sphaerochaeta sp.]